MKQIKLAIISSAIAIAPGFADPLNENQPNTDQPTREDIQEKLEQHSEGSKRLAFEQDDLSADVQDLIDEQTDAEIIGLLREIEVIMADATDLLEQKETGGATIAIETEVIEKIFEAAKKKQKKGG